MAESPKDEGQALFGQLVDLLRRPAEKEESIREDLAQAGEELEAFLRSRPDSVPALRLMAEVKHRQGQTGEARQLIAQAERLDPWNPEILIVAETLAEAEASNRKDSDPASAPWLDSELSSSVISPDDLAERALGAYKLGDLERAYSLSKLAYRLHAKQGHHLLEAWTAGAALDPKRTRQELALLAEEVDNEPYLFLALGSINNVLGRWEEAGFWLSKGLELEIEDRYARAMLLNELAYVMARQGDHLNDSLILVRRALDLFPDKNANGFIRDTLGLIYLKRGENEKALRNLLEAVSKDPGVISRLHLSIALMRNNDRPGALKQLSAIATTRPSLDSPHLEETQILRRVQSQIAKLEELLNLGGSGELEEAENLLQDLF